MKKTFTLILLFQVIACFSLKQIISKPFVPDIKKREIMNIILVNSVASSCGPLLGGYLYFFMPNINKESGSGVIAKDKNSQDVEEIVWLSTHSYPSRDLVEGIDGDPHYLITNKNNKLEKYAINAICTHLGCVVPWNPTEQKFMCPCHGSQYNNEGFVIRGPAPKSLKLGKVNINDKYVSIQQWHEIDFRDNSTPWWI